MKLKWYKDSASFYCDLEKIGWLACFKPSMAQQIKDDILATKVDPRNYFTIPFACLGFYIDLEGGTGGSYEQWVADLQHANRDIVAIDVLEEVCLPDGESVSLKISVAGRVFEKVLAASNEWVDPNIITFLRDSIEQATGEFTLISLNGVGQDPLLTIMKKAVIERCKEEGIFPIFDGADKDVEEISNQCMYD